MKSKLKKWPADDKPGSAAEIIQGVEQILRKGYRLERTKEPLQYQGYGLGIHSLGCSPDLNSTFTRSNLQYHAERDRDLLAVALMAVFNLGIEQGRRMDSGELSLLRRFVDDLHPLPPKAPVPAKRQRP